MSSDTNEKKIVSSKKVSLAVAMMTETLKHQKPVKCPSIPSWMQPIERYGWDSDCGNHESCASFKEHHFKKVSAMYPDCIVREFRDNGIKYFVVYSEFNQLSRRLGRGNTECLAWDNALKEISNLVGEDIR